ncbi:MAG: RIP metalloprotease RseP [Alphaproteobacteria bacterium]
MELISQIPVFGGFLSTIIAFVGVLGVVVFVHEYGHYIVGRWSGIHADVFSMGFGPVIWSRTDKRGTKWQLAAVPLGGYVKFLGDRNAASATDFEAMEAMSDLDRDVSFPGARVHHRAMTVVAGPLANFLLAAMIFTGISMWQGVATEVPTVGEVINFPGDTYDLREGDIILAINGKEVSGFGEIVEATIAMAPPGEMEILVFRGGAEQLVQAPYLLPAAVYGVEPLSAASTAGLQAGDVILQADGVVMNAFSDLREVVERSGDTEILMEVWREGEVLSLPITPLLKEFPNNDGGFDKRVMIGVSGAFAFKPATETPAIWTAAYYGGRRTYEIISLSLNGIKHMFLGNLSPSNLQGPIGIAQISKETANQGVISFISLIAIISTGIGLLNLFPIPMLDGGHLVFYAIEAVRGQPPAQKTIQVATSIGLAMVLLLMVFATYNDLLRL